MPVDLEERVLRHLGISSPYADVVSLCSLSEGMNMGIWIGFKHVNYVMEHAISRFLRKRGAGIRGLYWGDDLRVLFLSSRVRYLAALTFDEEVYVCMVPEASGDGTLTFHLHVLAERFGSFVRLARGTFRAGLFDREGRCARRLPESVATCVGGGLPARADSGSGRAAGR
jgi:acyl-CoA thioesterase FadM